jgi:hypothetical protein
LPFEPALAQFSQMSVVVGTNAVGAAAQGSSVAMSADGTTAIVGGAFDNTDAGAAWVFTRIGIEWGQQGSKLVGIDAMGPAEQGYSVALSGDGNTAIVGGREDNSELGAAWVWTRSSGMWSQQGSKLVGSDAVGSFVRQGNSVALSADGNTAIVGGPDDSSRAGAVWVWTRSSTGVWSQQGLKLVGTGAAGSTAVQGWSVALSADGNTALVGAFGDSSELGAAWVFTRSNGVWNQQGPKLVGGGAVGPAEQGYSIALSADGNTAILGGPGDDASAGAAWVFTRSGGVWNQQGSKLVGNGAVGAANQGGSVALSADGNIALVGGASDNGSLGAVWVFSRSNGVWTQQGSKLVGSNAIGAASQGYSVAISANGSTVIAGGPNQNNVTGAAWIFVRVGPPNTHDFNDDGISDIVWRDTGGGTVLWLMNGATVLSSGGLGNISTAWSIVGQHDFNGDNSADLVWRDSSGNTAIWFMNGTMVASSVGVGNIPTNWTIYGVTDLNGDGKGDLLWRDSNTGNVSVWFMNGAAVTGTANFGTVPSTWNIVAEDNKGTIFWRDTAGNIAVWQIILGTVWQSVSLGNVPPNWQIAGLGDFNGDGSTDILWRDTSGNTSIWLMNGFSVVSAGGLGNVPTTWSIVQIGDYNGDGKSDLLWRDNLGNTSMWFMNGTAISSTGSFGNVPTNWTVQSVNAE